MLICIYYVCLCESPEAIGTSSPISYFLIHSPQRRYQYHHQKRLDEILSILEGGKKNAFQVASQMSWDIIYDSWDLFPITQKWFAIGETLSHLKYLEEEGVVQRQMRRKKRVYSFKSRR
jgi:hypothetical protein